MSELLAAADDLCRRIDDEAASGLLSRETIMLANRVRLLIYKLKNEQEQTDAAS